MQQGFDPRRAIAALGPAACGECYEVGRDVIDRFRKEFRYWGDLLSDINEEGKAQLDIHAANTQQLLFCGFTEDRIHVSQHCTMHDRDLFFSYRREARNQSTGTGRLLSLIGKLGE
jgi:copper oxidase (laccase) domain-containing protein